MLHCFVEFHVLCAHAFESVVSPYGTDEACRLNQLMSISRMVMIKSILPVVFRKRQVQIKSDENCFGM